MWKFWCNYLLEYFWGNPNFWWEYLEIKWGYFWVIITFYEVISWNIYEVIMTLHGDIRTLWCYRCCFFRLSKLLMRLSVGNSVGLSEHYICLSYLLKGLSVRNFAGVIRTFIRNKNFLSSYQNISCGRQIFGNGYQNSWWGLSNFITVIRTIDRVKKICEVIGTLH